MGMCTQRNELYVVGRDTDTTDQSARVYLQRAYPRFRMLRTIKRFLALYAVDGVRFWEGFDDLRLCTRAPGSVRDSRDTREHAAYGFC